MGLNPVLRTTNRKPTQLSILPKSVNEYSEATLRAQAVMLQAHTRWQPIHPACVHHHHNSAGIAGVTSCRIRSLQSSLLRPTRAISSIICPGKSLSTCLISVCRFPWPMLCVSRVNIEREQNMRVNKRVSDLGRTVVVQSANSCQESSV